MDSAKAAVKDFLGRSGHHDTTVHEKVAPAVTHENIMRTEHENLQTAIDKEVHQDHYHTSVQPVQDQQKLQEQHHHNVIPVEHRNYEHGDQKDVERQLAMEQAKFKDEVTRSEGQHTTAAAPIVAGEHKHHHVHETIQPIVQRQTIEPHVVHTTVPIHEVHHNAAQHHAASALPPVSMADFKKQGGVLSGRDERYDGFEGEPRSIGNSGATGLEGATTGHGHNHSHHHGTDGVSSASSGTATNGGKPSLMDRVNPKVDADGDGKKGFMK